MEAVAPEVEFVGMEIAGCAMFPGETESDPPLMLRDVPIVVVRPPWDDLTQNEWSYADDMRLTMVMTDDCATINIGLYDPWVNFRVKVPLPDFQAEVDQSLEIGWVGIRDESGETCLVVKTDSEE